MPSGSSNEPLISALHDRVETKIKNVRVIFCFEVGNGNENKWLLSFLAKWPYKYHIISTPEIFPRVKGAKDFGDV